MITGNFDYRNLRQVKPEPSRKIIQMIPHHRMMEQVMREINNCHDEKKRYYKTGEVRCGLTPNDQDMIAAVEVFAPDVTLPDDDRLWLGVLNSNSGKRQCGLYGGVSSGGVTLVCEQYPLAKLRGEHVRPGEATRIDVAEALDNFIVQCGNFPNRVRELKHRYVSWPDADLLMIEACRRRVIPWSLLGHVEEERKSLADGKIDRDTKNAWLLYAACATMILDRTQPISHNPPSDQLYRLFTFRHLVLERVE